MVTRNNRLPICKTEGAYASYFIANKTKKVGSLNIGKGGEGVFNGEQLVDVKWNNTNKEWYENHGYVFTKRNSVFQVKAKDLKPGSNAKIHAVCDYCGEEYDTLYSLIYKGRSTIQKDCCSKCTGKKSSEISYVKRRDKYYNQFLDICKNNDYIPLTTKDEYTDVKMQVKYICPRHGEQTAMLENILHGHGCIKCSYEKRGEQKKFDEHYIVSEIEKIDGNRLLNPDEYIDCTTHNLRIRCSCGNTFTTSFVNYVKHNVNTCFSCSCKESSAEKIIREYLEDNCIVFEQEKRFDDCRDNKPLPFDFYLPHHNLIIEFDGAHHYKQIDNWGNHDKTIKHDEIKNKYCEDNSIRLIRIPYWEGNNIEAIMSEIIL